MNVIYSPEELALALGENIKTLRLQKNLTQNSLADQAGVSMTALRHLESGQGANLFTLIRIVVDEKYKFFRKIERIDY